MKLNLEGVTLSVTLACAAGGAEWEVPATDFPESILVDLLEHGLQQKLADPVSGAKAKGWDETKCLALVTEALAALKAGTWGKRNSGPRLSTFEAWCKAAAQAEAVERVKPGQKNAGKDPAEVAKALLAHPGWIAQTQTAWEAAKARAAAAKAERDAKAKAKAGAAEIDLDI